jgi:hypothetical protein
MPPTGRRLDRGPVSLKDQKLSSVPKHSGGAAASLRMATIIQAVYGTSSKLDQKGFCFAP